ncbi:MAG: hypothetical protein EOP86_13625 [Verrucomicrobiaceae bacterium]|nr:MAG: hypothetical protein EOP86_13625 [Verrucomicrobiaceae bacterium]
MTLGLGAGAGLLLVFLQSLTEASPGRDSLPVRIMTAAAVTLPVVLLLCAAALSMTAGGWRF